MNSRIAILDVAVVALGLAILLADLWTPPADKRKLGWLAALALGLILCGSFVFHGDVFQTAFNGMYVLDGLALHFKRFFLLAAIIVLVMSARWNLRTASENRDFGILRPDAFCAGGA